MSPLCRTMSAGEPRQSRRHVQDAAVSAEAAADEPPPQASALRVLKTCARETLAEWHSGESPRAAVAAGGDGGTGRCGCCCPCTHLSKRSHSCIRGFWRVCSWPVELVFHVAGAALHNALLSLSVFLILHLFPVCVFPIQEAPQ
jgi:hypothetical protein